MVWEVLFHEKFELEFNELPQAVQDELLEDMQNCFKARVRILKDLTLIHLTALVMTI
ncbi:hypothetical protein NIES4071_72140 [Calothrix sp. NIES-4071]|nr:hypothetical protein NIES4071_72140 [Calothrix sp. NIES-4071]BAZ61489.1 hypothetical protein NIES4105_72090 [Calothrix sp. NIES-4105]